VRVLIVEDSPTSRDSLLYILNLDPELRVIALAGNGEQSIAAVMDRKPDIVIMDVHMPVMDGYEATRRIMSTHPVPIIIVSETFDDQAEATFAAYDAGALAFLRHPPGLGHPEHAAAAQEFRNMLKLMAEVRVVRRWSRREQPHPAPEPRDTITEVAARDIRVVAIGASTGGPIVLQGIMNAIAPSLNVPVLIVQHIAPGFVQGFAGLLGACGRPVHVAADGEPALPGHIYVAPDDRHMGMDAGGRIRLSSEAPEHGMRPSVSSLFRSVAWARGRHVIGVLLTGMGKDGADGLKLIRDQGGITIAQDEKTSVVHGMPGEAIDLDAAAYVLSPEKIAEKIIFHLDRHR
jgi:two-component system chemotaxis response regulator CheB